MCTAPYGRESAGKKEFPNSSGWLGNIAFRMTALLSPSHWQSFFIDGRIRSLAEGRAQVGCRNVCLPEPTIIGQTILTNLRLRVLGTICPSVNHRTSQQEIGLSVAEGPWFYSRHSRWCYFISGQEVARGSDSEPLLAVTGLTVEREITYRRRLLEEFHIRNKERLSSVGQETGVSVVELFALLIAL
jgi:hypothetical protein